MDIMALSEVKRLVDGCDRNLFLPLIGPPKVRVGGVQEAIYSCLSECVRQVE